MFAIGVRAGVVMDALYEVSVDVVIGIVSGVEVLIGVDTSALVTAMTTLDFTLLFAAPCSFWPITVLECDCTLQV